jgi:hypothetical protein
MSQFQKGAVDSEDQHRPAAGRGHPAVSTDAWMSSYRVHAAQAAADAPLARAMSAADLVGMLTAELDRA